MKRIFFLLVSAALITLVACDAQKREINSIEKEARQGNLVEAKTRIDSILQTDAKELPNAWVVKADVYMNIFTAEEDSIKELHQDPLGQAYDAVKKAKEIDENNQLFLVLQQKELQLSQLLHAAGADAFNEGRYPLASNYFYYSHEINEELNAVDTLTLYYAAVAAERGMMYEEARDYLTTLVDMEYDEPGVYVSLINVASATEDQEDAEKWIKAGKEKYDGHEGELSILFAEANYYLKSGNAKGAEKAISAAIERQPDNPNLHFALGGNYERIYNDSTFTEEQREDAFNKAVKAYEKALELSPDRFDIIFSLGALYFNKGIKIFEEADAELREDFDFDAYKEKEKEFKSMWLKSQPYLEKSLEMIEPSNENYRLVINSLRELYARTDQEEKLNEVLEIIKERGFDQEVEQEPNDEIE